MKAIFNKYLLFLTLAVFLCLNIDIKANSVDFKPSSFSKNNEIVITPWNNVDGIKRLERSEYKGDFYRLASNFQPQINPLYCGIASSVIVLNTLKDSRLSQKELEISKPESYGGGITPFNSYSQITFLNERTNKIKQRDVIELKNLNDDESSLDPGVTLDQLSRILNKAYKLKISAKHVPKVSDGELKIFRNIVKNILNDKKKFILVNFKGSTIGLETGGHISPIAAYDEASDTILVLDVAGHNNPWYWVKLEHLFKSMNTLDGKDYRGYLIVSN